MKMVRYAIGALGAAPVLGMMGPVAANANATTGPVHKPGSAGKTVSLGHSRILTCGTNHVKFASKGLLHAAIYYSGTTCIHQQSADLDRAQTGLTERARFYSGNGRLEDTTWQAGYINSNHTSTYFHSTPNVYAHEVCEALVANGNHNDVKYGPVCEIT